MISIIIPVYKVEKYLQKCIQSVEDQVFTDWELILVDDGSPDRCGAICDSFAESDPRIHVIHQENAGLSAARNAGMKVIAGSYVTFIDSDDFIDPDYLSSLYAAATESGADISITGYRDVIDDETVQPGTESQVRQGICSGREACIRLMTEEETFMITAWGKLYSRKLFPLIHYPEGRLNEDEYVTYRLFYESGHAAFTGTSSYNYLHRSGSITAAFSLKHLRVLDAFRDAAAYFEEKNDPEMTAYAQKRLLREIRVLYLKSDQLPKEERSGLITEWRSTYQRCRSRIAGITSFQECLADRLFFAAPVLYARLRNSVILNRQ